MSLVLPGVPDVIASFALPQSMFIRDDFPTLDLPMKANSGSLRAVCCSTRVLLPANIALKILMF